MPHFLIQSNNIQNDLINISDNDLMKHFATLRIRNGENVKFIDENEIQYFCETLDISKKNGTFKILKKEKSKRKLDFELYLAQVVLKTVSFPITEHYDQERHFFELKIQCSHPRYVSFCHNQAPKL